MVTQLSNEVCGYPLGLANYSLLLNLLLTNLAL
jgi:hypothetical protein